MAIQQLRKSSKLVVHKIHFLATKITTLTTIITLAKIITPI